MVVQHNMIASNASRQLGINTTNKSKSTERLSSGYRINRAADDAAGLAISEKMRWSVRGLHQASRNIEDGASLVQTADGGMSEIHAVLQRQRELAVQAGNDTNTPEDRNAIQQEMNALSAEISRIANDTTFNTRHILNCEGNLEYGPVNADSAVTTLLGNPGSTENGVLTGFMATNAAGTIQSQLLYGGNSATTSFVEAKVTVGGDTYTLRTRYISSGDSTCTVTNDTTSVPNGIKTTFAYHPDIDDDGTPDPLFSLVRTIEKIANPTGTGEVYKMTHELINDTTEEITGSIEVSLDVKFTGNDNPSFLMDDNVDETVITHAVKYGRNAMPSIMNLYSTNNPYLNVQAIVQGHGTTTPDYVKIGQYSKIAGSDWRVGTTITDSAYDVGWENIRIAAGASSGERVTMYGVSDPLLNPVLTGNQVEPIELNIQASDRAHTAIKIPLVDCTAERLGVATLNVTSYDDAGASLNKIDKAIDKVSEYRASMGAIYNRLEKAKNNVDNEEENVQSAESRIRDTDMAEEMVAYSKHSILEQAGISVLAQAGKINEGVLELLR